jgi:NAD(P) transhydrogenase
LIVVGAGVIGMEYASMVGIVPGTTVTIIDPRQDVLSFADQEVTRLCLHTLHTHYVMQFAVHTCSILA